MSRKKGMGAPLIESNGDKWNDIGPRNKDNENGLLFGQIPSILRRYIFNHLTGNNGNMLKIMILFIEQKDDSWRASKEWVLKETGMTSDKYYKAREMLEDLGWLTCTDESILINYDYLWSEAWKEYNTQNNNDTQRQRFEPFQKRQHFAK